MQNNSEISQEAVSDAITKWENETAYLSDITKKKESVWFRLITSLGSKAVPFILTFLQENQSWAVLALDEVVEEKPEIHTDVLGNLEQTIAIWLAWGKEQGYLDD